VHSIEEKSLVGAAKTAAPLSGFVTQRAAKDLIQYHAVPTMGVRRLSRAIRAAAARRTGLPARLRIPYGLLISS
jgi:hypothetical protein